MSGYRRALMRSTVVLCILVAAACGSNAENGPRVPLGTMQAAGPQSPLNPRHADVSPAELPPPARQALDSGNAQYRAGQYAQALVSYRLAAESAPGDLAPEYGVYMAASKLGNAALADSAQRIIAAHTGDSPAWTDSAMRREHGTLASPHPAF